MAINNKRIVAIIPAYNEAQSIEQVVSELLELKEPILGGPLIDQVLVGDNGSNDGTGYLAEEAGATVIRETRKGYGAACLACLHYLKQAKSPKPDYIVFVDGDASVDSKEVNSLLKPFSQNADLVIGVRSPQLQEPNSLSIHQQIGTSLACSLISFIWDQKVSDLGPFRAIKVSALNKIDMQDQKFGWTVEMQVKAIQKKLNIAEVEVSTLARIGKSKISGTIRGTIGAAKGIFGTIFSLYFNQANYREPKNVVPTRRFKQS